jgi:septal ring factor EnvC (AmiA/AmiB activator)
MPKPARFAARPVRCLIFAALLGCLAITPLQARQDSKSEQAEAKQKLAELRHKMEALAKEQADTAARRDSVNAELAKQANALAGAARAVRQTDAELAAKQQQLDQLQQ